MGTGKVLTEEDFKEGHESEDTSKAPPQEEVIEGKEREEPEKEEVSAAEKEPQPKPSEEKKYKYTSMEEYDKAYREAERKMHEATTEKAELRKKLEQYERPKEEPDDTPEGRIKQMARETLAKIRALPADDPNREENATLLWSVHADNVAKLRYDEESKKANVERDVVRRTYDYATKEGIKTDAELKILGYEFSKTDPRLPVDERISQAVGNTKDVISQLRDGFVEKQEKDKKEKEDLRVLGRGSSRREKSEEEDKKPVTMSQQLAELNEKRRIKREDIR